jgi:hypothetical protein
MNQPNPTLLQAYGNEDVYAYKVAGLLFPGFELLRAHAGFEHGLHDVENFVRQKEEAKVLTEHFNEIQARRMHPVYREMADVHPYAYSERAFRARILRSPAEHNHLDMDSGLADSMNTEMVHLASIASDIGMDLALYEKNAGVMSAMAKGLPGKVLQGAGSYLQGAAQGAAKSFSRGVQGAGAAVGGAVQNAAKSMNRGINNLGGKVTNAFEQVGTGPSALGDKIKGRLEAKGQQMSSGMAHAPNANFHAPSAGQLKPAANTGGTVGQAIPDAATQSRMATKVAPGQVGVSGVPNPGATTYGGNTTLPNSQHTVTHAPGAPGAPAAPSGQVAAAGAGQVGAPADATKPSGWDRTGLSGGRWKTKVPLMVGGLAAGAGLYAGGKAALNYLGKEPQPYSYGGGAQLQPGVNEYGYSANG